MVPLPLRRLACYDVQASPNAAFRQREMTNEQELLRCAPLPGYWFHSIEVVPGIWTNGVKDRQQMETELSRWEFPDDLTGKTVLDVGCADGAWSIAALRRGASSVLAIDEQTTTGLRLILTSGYFPGLEFREISLFSEEFMALPKFDFVVFAGVLYHVQDMLEALKRVRSRAMGSVLIETHVNESAGTSPPLAVFYETTEHGQDPTNWWGPNIPCLEAMFRVAGFSFRQTGIYWENSLRANGRISYILDAVPGSVFADITSKATGSNSMLEEARAVISRLHAENVSLREQLTTSFSPAPAAPPP